MKFLLLSWPEGGHLYPLLTLIKGIRQSNNTCVVFSTKQYENSILSVGGEFRNYPFDIKKSNGNFVFTDFVKQNDANLTKSSFYEELLKEFMLFFLKREKLNLLQERFDVAIEDYLVDILFAGAARYLAKELNIPLVLSRPEVRNKINCKHGNSQKIITLYQELIQYIDLPTRYCHTDFIRVNYFPEGFQGIQKDNKVVAIGNRFDITESAFLSLLEYHNNTSRLIYFSMGSSIDINNNKHLDIFVGTINTIMQYTTYKMLVSTSNNKAIYQIIHERFNPYIENKTLIVENFVNVNTLHNKTSIFISACAANTLYEGLYLGNFMICIPTHGEGRFGGRRVKYFKVGNVLDKKSPIFVDKLLRLIKNYEKHKKYYDSNITKVQKMFFYSDTAKIAVQKLIDKLFKMENNITYNINDSYFLINNPIRTQTCAANSNITYSWHKEDVIFDRVLFSHKKSGIYVDIGSYHPIDHSNTKFLYNNGWRGVNVDPAFKHISAMELERQTDINLHYAVSNISNQTLEMIVYGEESSVNKDYIRRVSKKKRYKKVNPKKEKVKTITLQEICKLIGNKDIDLLDIDVEKYELEVLQGNDWQTCRPLAIVIELYHSGKKIDDFLKKVGYQNVTSIGKYQNTVYIRNEYPNNLEKLVQDFQFHIDDISKDQNIVHIHDIIKDSVAKSLLSDIEPGQYNNSCTQLSWGHYGVEYSRCNEAFIMIYNCINMPKKMIIGYDPKKGDKVIFKNCFNINYQDIISSLTKIKVAGHDSTVLNFTETGGAITFYNYEFDHAISELKFDISTLDNTQYKNVDIICNIDQTEYNQYNANKVYTVFDRTQNSPQTTIALLDDKLLLNIEEFSFFTLGMTLLGVGSVLLMSSLVYKGIVRGENCNIISDYDDFPSALLHNHSFMEV